MFLAKKPEFDARGGYPVVLASLGLTQELIEQALAYGVRRYNRRADGLPRSYAGQIPSAHAKASLARALGAITEQAWAALESSHGGICWLDEDWRLKTTTQAGLEAFTVKVWLGDENTGIDGNEEPRPRNRKGPETLKDMMNNHPQPGLFDNMPADVRAIVKNRRPVDQNNGTERVFAVILYRYTLEENRCRIYWELSIPGIYDEAAETVAAWAHREVYPEFIINLGSDGDTYDSGPDLDPSLGRG